MLWRQKTHFYFFFLLQVKETGDAAIVGAYMDLVSSSMQPSAKEPKVGNT